VKKDSAAELLRKYWLVQGDRSWISKETGDRVDDV
jgi:hypothetical protein